MNGKEPEYTVGRNNTAESLLDCFGHSPRNDVK